MKIGKTITEKGRALSMVLLGVLFSTPLIGEVRAQTKSSVVQPALAKSPGTMPNAARVTAACPPLLSPFSSPATKARIRQSMEAENSAITLARAGDVFAQSRNWQSAQSQYQQALDLSPEQGLGHQLALYGLIACCRASGDTTKGLDYSRQAVYHHGSAAEGFQENNTEKLMQFALLLNKTGRSNEAMSVYNRAASALDYQDSQSNGGKPHLKVLFPEIVTGDPLPNQVQYTPARLQALVDVALAFKQNGFWSYKEIKAHAQEAARLYPDSAAVQYYVGDALSGSYYAVLDSPAKDKAAARAAYEEDKKAVAVAYQKAADLGDVATTAAAKEQLKTVR